VSHPQIALVAALDEADAIGVRGGLPWSLPDDLKRFRALTMGKPVIVGRRTWESIGRPLPGRHLIVWTRQPLDLPAQVHRAASQAEALALAQDLAPDAQEVIIAGGAGVYEAFLPLASTFYLTRVHTTVPDADTLFPRWDFSQWREISHDHHPADARHAHAYSTLDLARP
jgi:dihydrofolate reductase